MRFPGGKARLLIIYEIREEGNATQKKSLPKSLHFQAEADDRPFATQKIGLEKRFRLLARAADHSQFALRINEPREMGAIGEPVGHLLLQVAEGIARRTQLDHKFGTEREEFTLFLGSETVPLLQGKPGSIGGTNRSIGKRKAAVRVEGNAASVALGPQIELTGKIASNSSSLSR